MPQPPNAKIAACPNFTANAFQQAVFKGRLIAAFVLSQQCNLSKTSPADGFHQAGFRWRTAGPRINHLRNALIGGSFLCIRVNIMNAILTMRSDDREPIFACNMELGCGRIYRGLVPSPGSSLAALGVVLSAATIVLFLTDLETRYWDRIAAAKTDAQSFATILAEHTALTFEDVDRVLLEAEAIRRKRLLGKYADSGGANAAFVS